MVPEPLAVVVTDTTGLVTRFSVTVSPAANPVPVTAISTPGTVVHSEMRAVQSRGTPVVFVDRAGIDIQADSVVLDNREGSRVAVQHLIEGGHTSIAFIGDISRLETHRERPVGFTEAMTAAGLDADR